MAAAFCLVSFLGNWNAFFAPNIFLHSQDKLTLPIILNLYLSEYGKDYGVFLAVEGRRDEARAELQALVSTAENDAEALTRRSSNGSPV